jgi:drug/metabolite transporter (DMT)-like permease
MRGEKLFIYNKKMIIPLINLTVFNIYLTNVPEFWGLQFLSAAKASFIYNFSPFFAALLSYFVFGEVMTRNKWLGLVIGLLGFLPILIHEPLNMQSWGGFAFLSWPEIALLTAAISTVIGWISMRYLIKANIYSSITANGISMLLSSILIFPTSLLVEQWDPYPVMNWSKFIFYLLILTLISNIIAYNTYGILLRRYTATFLLFAGFTGPLFAALFSWLFLRETVSWCFFLSVIIVFTGLFIFYREELQHGPILR